MSGPAVTGDRDDGRPTWGAEAGGAGPRGAAARAPSGAPPVADGTVHDLARTGLAQLRDKGIEVEVVRTRANCLVVRSTFRSPGEASRGRPLVSDWLGSLPRLAHRTAGTVVESACAPGGQQYIHTLLWSNRAFASPAPAAPIPLDPPAPAVSPPAPLAQPPPPWPTAAPPPPPSPRPAPSYPDGAPASGPDTLPVSRPGDYLPGAVTWSPELAAPGPVVPGAAVPARRPGLPTVEGEHGSRAGGRAAPPAGSGLSSSGRRRAWLRRRGWMVVLGLVAGAVGGQFASGHGTPSYSASAVLVVQSGASPTGPGSANTAEELAITYAALIPDDQGLIRGMAKELGTSPQTVSADLSVEAESGTSLLVVRYSSSSPTKAVEGAEGVARVLSSTTPPGHAIAAGSVATVSPPRSAALSGSLRKDGLPLGVLLGLVVGCGAALVAERADRRVDDLESLGDGAGCPATAVPGGISTTELALALERDVDAPVTVVPLRPAQSRAAGHLAHALSSAWPVPGERPAAGVSPAFSLAPELLGNRGGATVMVVGAGERLRLVHEMAERLRLVGRAPAWAVLDVGTSTRVVRGRGS